MNSKNLKNVDWWTLILPLAMCIISFIALYSTTGHVAYEDLKKQIIWVVAGLILAAIFMIINYRILVKISPIFYGLSIILLIAVMFTRPINGARSWFNIAGFTLQPAEMAKVPVILCLTWAMTKIQEKGKEQINKIWKLAIIIGILALPIALIILEPDLGTATAYIVAFAMMIFVSGIDKKYIIAVLLLVAIGIPLAYQFVLPQHAKKRIDVFLNPESDPKGAGYNVLQSKLAIGSGELTGMGVLNGNQTQLGYLSPKTTDFIFSVIGEEMGFLVAGGIIIAYVFLITKALFIAKTSKDDAGSYIAAGISGIFFFHMAENIGMTMGLLPITGVPLLFISYGGSSMLSSFICIGLLLNISGNRKKTIFVK